MRKLSNWISLLFINQPKHKNLISNSKKIALAAVFLISNNALAAPATPTTVTATANSSSITVNWSASSGATRYDIVRNGNVSALGNTTAFIDTTVTAGSSYVYGIRACDGTGCSSWKDAPQVIVPIAGFGTPLPPTSIATSTTNSIVNVSWTSSTGATTYILERNNGVVTTGAITNFSDATVVLGTSYIYRVKACNGSLCSDWKTSSAVQLPPPPPPQPSPITTIISSSTITLNWPWSIGATSFKVVKNGNVTETNTNSFTWSNVSPGTYGVGVTACIGTSCSTWNNLSVTIPIIGAPNTPSIITTSINNNIIKISWAISEGATNYVLERNNTLITSGSITSFNDTTGVIGTSYIYRVKACNGSLCSDWKISSAVQLPPPPPPQPSPITTIISSSTITLNWPWSTGATSFKVVKNGNVTETNTNSFTWSNVTPDTYGVGVTACIGTSCSAWNNLSVTVTETQPIPNVVDSERSLFIRDQATLKGADFSLNSVLAQLAIQLNASNPSETVTSTKLFARFWDTQNLAPGSIAGGPKCTNSLNGFPYECRPDEGIQAQDTSFLNSYIPIALVNRFDLRDKVNFNDCGEYRIVYAITGRSGRNFIIFEAQVPNPTPGSAAGCSPIVSFWANLSTETNTTARAVALRNFYFTGIPSQGVRAVIDTRNYSPGTGQIRTNQFIGSTWVLHEFKVTIEGGVSIIKPVTVKANPFGSLFNNSRTDTLAVNFRNQFLNNMGSLLISDISTFSLTVQSDIHNNGQSHASGPISENNFTQHTNLGNGDFKSAIQTRAIQLGSNLTADQVINRAKAMTCGGCHQPSAFDLTGQNSVGNNQTWPGTLSFVHVSESISNGKFNISPALQNVFIPSRKTDFEAFINTLNTATTSSTTKTSTSTSLQKTSSPTITGKRSG